jgi:transposase
MLVRAEGGEKKVWSVVNVPTPVEEDRRQVHRELLFARRDRGRHVRTARQWDGTPLPPLLCARLEREWDTVQEYTTRIRALKRERRALLRIADDPAIARVRQLNQLRGIGIDSAWLYVMEFFAWRQFRNRRQVGGLAGLTGTPYQSGDLQHEQGISKAGNRWVRALAINTAWAWLRFQPKSQLARWYQKKFGQGNSRIRKIGIVALARKLLIALWRYLDQGLRPEGAVLRG